MEIRETPDEVIHRSLHVLVVVNTIAKVRF